MTSAYSSIANVYVGSSSFRWIRNTTGQFSVWNPDNGQYRAVDLPAALGLPTEVHLALDETGNAYFLGQTNGIWSIAIWNSDTLSFGSTLYITPPASQSYTSFAVANNVYWFVSQSGNIYSSPVGATDTPSLVAQAGDFLGNPLQIVTGHQDGSVWLLDNAGNVYSWDGDGFSPLSSGAPLSPPGKLSELSVVDSSLIYGLDNNGRIWQWSTFAKEFVYISSSINNNGNLQFASIQADEAGILYTLASSGSENGGQYLVFDLSDYQDLANPNSAANSIATYTDGNGVSHAIWNQDGLLYYGYQTPQAASSGFYIGVKPLGSGPGQTPQGSALDLALTSGSGGGSVAQATWIDSGSGQIYGATLRNSLYGGYEWSPSTQLSFDTENHKNLQVEDLGNGKALLTTSRGGKTISQWLNLANLAGKDETPVTPFNIRGQGYVVDVAKLAQVEGLDIPTSNFSIKYKYKEKTTGTNLKDVDVETGWTVEGSVNQKVDDKTASTVYAPSNSMAAYLKYTFTSTLRPYITYDLEFSGAGSGEWPSLQPYPERVTLAGTVKGSMKVDALAAVADALAPGSGAAIETVENAQSFLKLKAGPYFELGATIGAAILNSSPTGDSNYLFEVKSWDEQVLAPNTPVSSVFWEFQPQNAVGLIPEFLASNYFLSLGLSAGVFLEAKGEAGGSGLGASLSIKAGETTSITEVGDKITFREVANYKWSFDVKLVMFTISFGGSGSDILVNKPLNDIAGQVDSRRGLTPRTTGYEPSTTTHLLLTAAGLGESNADLVDGADIAWVVAADGTTVYGVFVGEAIANPADFSSLYFIQGALTADGMVAWNVATLVALPGTAGANQAPNIALDSNGHLLITWQYADLTNPAVQTLAQTPPGQVYVIYNDGAAVNLANIDNTPTLTGQGFAWTLNDEYFSSLGQSVSALGDLNGGGKDDFALAAPDLNQEQGGVFLVYGESFIQVSDLDNLGTYGVALSGQALSELGYSLANAGDVNGDGVADLIIGAPGLIGTGGGPDQGAAYLIYGGTTLFSKPQTTQDIDVLLANNPTYGMAIQGGQVGGRFGNAVTGGFDVTGDGRSDVAISSPFATPAGAANSQLAQQSGTVSIVSLVEGNPTLTTVTITNSTGNVNSTPLMDIGTSVAIVPDLNGDGKADLVIGGSGAAVVVFGSATTFSAGTTFDLANLAVGQGFVIEDDSSVFTPLLVGSAGDVNLDGTNDLLISSPATADEQGNVIAGKTYVLFGGTWMSNSSNGIAFSAIEQGNGSQGFVIEGAGTEAAGVGDLNGDGAADLVVSEPQANGQAGISYLVYGGTANHIGSVATLNVADVGGSVQGYTIGGAGADDLSGTSISSVGDINGDGRTDLLLGAPNTPSQTAMNNLQSTLKTNYLTAYNPANGQFSTPSALPYVSAGEPSLDSLALMETSQGILATWIDSSSGVPALMAAFWSIGDGWQNQQATITTGNANTSFDDIQVAGGGSSVVLSWVENDNSLSTSKRGQSTFTKNTWTTASYASNASTSPQFPDQIDNIITNNNSSVVANAATSYSVLDRVVNEDSGNIVFTVKRSGDLSKSSIIRYRTEDVSATAGADYEHLEGTLQFLPGQAEQTIAIKITSDHLHEHLGEDFLLKLSNDEGVKLQARATLQDATPVINLLAIDSGFQMSGPGQASLGAAVAPAGNVGGAINNSTGPNAGKPLDSLWIGAPGAASNSGALYLLRGQAGAEAVDTGLNLDNPGSSTTVIKVTGSGDSEAANPQMGYSLTSWQAGSDQNPTDPVAGVSSWYAVSAPNLSGQGGQNDSQIYVFDSSALPGTSQIISINTLAAHPVIGNSADGFGATVALADLNGNGRPELIVGAPLAGKVFVYSLSGSGSTISASLVSTITAPSGVGLGASLAVLDINGDKNLDIAMGAPLFNPVKNSQGAILGYGGGIYVLQGNGQLPPSNNVLPATPTYIGEALMTSTTVSGTLNPSTGETSGNPNPSPDTPFYDSLGNGLAVLDLNGDQIADMAMGAPTAAANGVSGLGKAYVVFGGSGALSATLSSLAAGKGLTLQGALANGQAGRAVADAGDVNNDGIHDLLVGAPLGYGNAGAAYLLFGSTNAYTSGSGVDIVTLDPNLVDSRVFQFQGVANPLSNTNIFNPGSLGYALGGIGDINGDYGSPTGGADILLGAPSSNDGSGNAQAYVAIGHPWLQGGLALSVHELRGDNGFVLTNPNPAVPVGDMNADGFADFVNLGAGVDASTTGNLLTLGASTLDSLNGPRTFAFDANFTSYQLGLTKGNLVLFDGSGAAIWSSNASDTSAVFARVDQGIGSFQLVNSEGTVTWEVFPPYGETHCSLRLSADGALYVADASGKVLVQISPGDPTLPGSQLVLAPNQEFSTIVNTVLSREATNSISSELLFVDGVLVIQTTVVNSLNQATKTTVWSANTNGMAVEYAKMNTNGDFALYGGMNNILWHTNTENNPGAYLELSSNGTLQVISKTGSVLKTLHTGPAAPATMEAKLASGEAILVVNNQGAPVTPAVQISMQSQLVLQPDGNLQLQAAFEGQPLETLWSTTGQNLSPGYAAMSGYGDFTLFDALGHTVWSSDTQSGSARLSLSATGTLKVISASGATLSTIHQGSVFDNGATYLNPNQQLSAHLNPNSRVFTNFAVMSSDSALISSGDYDADGYTDVVSVNGSDQILVHGGTPVVMNMLTPVVSLPVSTAGNEIVDLLSADLNGDGYDDLAVLNSGSSGDLQLTFFLGSGSGLQAQVTTFSLGAPVPGFNLALGDIDIDANGTKEIIVSTFSLSGSTPVRLSAWQFDLQQGLVPMPIGTGAAAYDSPQDGPSPSANTALTTGDFNGDGYEDLLFSAYVGGQNLIWSADTIFWGTGSSATFGQKQTTVSEPNLTGSQPPNLPSASIAVGDVNADGYDDFLLSQILPNYNGTPLVNNTGWLQLGSALIGQTSISRGAGNDQIAVEGLPNRTHPYGISPAGDVNGDGYEDLLMSDQDYQLSYVVYGQDWRTEAEGVGYVFYDGTNGKDVFEVPGNYSPGTHVVINGMNGDDYTLVPLSSRYAYSVTAFGGAGNDTFGLGGTDSAYLGKINGGSGYDTIFIPANLGGANSLDLTARPGLLESIECIDLGFGNSVTFGVGVLLASLDSNRRLVINGVSSYARPNDPASITWSKIGSDAANGTVYDIYGVSGSALEVWVQQNGVLWDPVIPSLPPTLSMRPGVIEKAEGNIGSTSFTFSIQRDGDDSVAVSVDWTVTGSSSNPANALDFAGATLPSGIATLAAGETSQQITINVVGDRLFEPDESFLLSLSNPVGGTLLDGATTISGRIQNDDLPSLPAYTFTKSTEAVDEGSSIAIGVSTANVAPGSPLYWRFSGNGITAADFSDGLLEGSTVLGTDGRAGFSKLISPDAIHDPDETLELRFFNDAARTLQVGATVTALIKQLNVGVVTDGSDVITGGSAAEVLIGVPAGSTLRGRGSLDRLTGEGGDDLFVLGDATGPFYDDGTPGLGSADLALITDFSAGDLIQLHGLATDYRLVSGRYAGLEGVRIDALLTTPEAIGFVQGSRLESLSLANPSQFVFL